MSFAYISYIIYSIPFLRRKLVKEALFKIDDIVENPKIKGTYLDDDLI